VRGRGKQKGWGRVFYLEILAKIGAAARRASQKLNKDAYMLNHETVMDDKQCVKILRSGYYYVEKIQGETDHLYLDIPYE
jgi:hypothetical protein